MTYRVRGRSIVELVIAVTFVGFLTGFVTVLCIGNYLRAKRAMERQRQRRLARLAGGGGNGGSGVLSPPESPQRSAYSSAGTTSSSVHSGGERQHLLLSNSNARQRPIPQHLRGKQRGGGAPIEQPDLLDVADDPYEKKSIYSSQPHRRVGDEDGTDSLVLLDERTTTNGGAAADFETGSDVMSV